jgi:pimeloyl-ACP methyl ester carboxylesterase
MRNLFLLFFSFIPLAASAQTRYKDAVFPEYTLDKNGVYTDKGSFDLYQPRGDSAGQRPLMIWMHGGGFKFGSRHAEGTRLWCRSFAQRGYVCAAIDYPLGKKNFNFSFADLVGNCYQAVQAVRKAVAYFKANAARWNLDTTRIVLAGNSAGGMLALQAVYSSNGELQRLPMTKAAAKPGWDAEDMAGGGSDPGGIVGGETAGGVAAIVNFWGGVFDTLWLRQAKVPIVSVHGDRDGIVPYDHKGFPLFGSLPIHRMADSLGIPNALKTFEGYSHELQRHFFPLVTGHGTKKRWSEAGQFAADFLYKTLFQ